MKWTQEEVEKLVENYPLMGYRVCDLFPDRTKASVIRKAELLRLKVDRKVRDGLKADRIGILDIECSGLKANFGVVYSWYIKELGTDNYDFAVITRKELMNGTLDKRIIQELVEKIQKYTLIVTYFGSRFDVPFLRTRALMNGIEFIPYGEILHKDMYYIARRVLRLHSNRLECVCDALGIPGKTKIDNKYWILANTGNKEALEYIRQHNLGDVNILEEVYLRLAEFTSTSRRWL